MSELRAKSIERIVWMTLLLLTGFAGLIAAPRYVVSTESDVRPEVRLTMTRVPSSTGDYALGLTGAPRADATSAIVRIGNAFAGGNATANGGTYLGANAPSSFVGNFADWKLNGGASLFKLTYQGVLSLGTALGATMGGTAQSSWATGDLLYATGTNTLGRLAAGSNTNVLTLASGIPSWAAPATAGTVTSVAQTVPSWLTIGGSPITTSGTLAISATSGQTANYFLGTPDGMTGAVGPRALASGDVPTLSGSKITGGTFGAVNGSALTSLTPGNITGQVLVPQGGTGLGTLTIHAAYVGNGTSAPTALAVGATNSVLQGSTGADPAFTTTPTVSTLSATTSVSGPIIHPADSVQQLAAAGNLVLTAGKSFFPVRSTSGAVTGCGIAAGSTVGQEIILNGTDTTNVPTFTVGAGNIGFNAAGNRQLKNEAIWVLYWSSNAKWEESSFHAGS